MSGIANEVVSRHIDCKAKRDHEEAYIKRVHENASIRIGYC